MEWRLIVWKMGSRFEAHSEMVVEMMVMMMTVTIVEMIMMMVVIMMVILWVWSDAAGKHSQPHGTCGSQPAQFIERGSHLTDSGQLKITSNSLLPPPTMET